MYKAPYFSKYPIFLDLNFSEKEKDSWGFIDYESVSNSSSSVNYNNSYQNFNPFNSTVYDIISECLYNNSIAVSGQESFYEIDYLNWKCESPYLFSATINQFKEISEIDFEYYSFTKKIDLETEELSPKEVFFNLKSFI
jgi:hypothetical protein